ncbi:MAG TPA: coniferyl-alcohol dehydrogenase [Sphingobium sp.]|uniref:coniferyl-alcohol dehydrogenase n=1 Tax=Sphingobium sp. TaxID=1912891 RepID=UPI002ECFFF67
MTDPHGYRGKRVFVTGCSSGIGHATARMLLDAGAQVHGLDWRSPSLALSGFSQVDLRDRSAIDQAVLGISSPVDALFNCAGLPPMHLWLDVMKVNFIGMRHLSEAIAARMAPGSAIVTVGSNGGAGWRQRLVELRNFIATTNFEDAVRWCEANDAPQNAAYNFAKEAIVVWTLAWSASTIARGIRLNCTSPGAVDTAMLAAIEEVTPPGLIDAVAQPIGRRSTPQEQANVLLMLNSPQASYVNGVDLPVDGGFIAAQTVAD